MPVTVKEIAWLAGLLEGEGCFTIHSNRVKGKRSYAISLRMTDEDIVARASALMKAQYYPVKRVAGRKQAWCMQKTGNTAAAWIMTILPFLGQRRKARALEVLQWWKETLSWRGDRYTNCKRGHEFSEENTYYSKVQGGKRRRTCRACAMIRKTRYRGRC